MKMVSKIIALLVAPLMVAALGVSLVSAPVEAAAGSCDTAGKGGIKGGLKCVESKDTPNDLFGSSGIFKTIVDILLFIIGAIAVIMLIIGGVRYTTSNGDQKAVESAKNTIMYAIIGIIVAILAYAIVGFVVNSLV